MKAKKTIIENDQKEQAIKIQNTKVNSFNDDSEQQIPANSSPETDNNVINNIALFQESILETFSNGLKSSINAGISVLNANAKLSNNNSAINLHSIKNLVESGNCKDFVNVYDVFFAEITKSYSKYLQDLFSVYNLINKVD